MPLRSTLLAAYLRDGEIILFADGRAAQASIGYFSDGTQKLILTGVRSACAIGGSCEVIVRAGAYAGQHWRLRESLEKVKSFPASSPEERARHLFDAAFAAAGTWIPRDTDPGSPGLDEKGITVLYAERSKDQRAHLWRADLPIECTKDGESFSWSVHEPKIRPIVSGVVREPIFYFHIPDDILPIGIVPPREDVAAGKGLPGLIRSMADKLGIGEHVGGATNAIRIDGNGARWILKTPGQESDDTRNV